MKICPMGAVPRSHKDGQMKNRHDKASSRFTLFCKCACQWNSLIQHI